MTMAILFAVIGILLGAIIGLFIGNSLNSNSSVASSPATVVAPTLTQDQMNSGQLPAGHPKINNARPQHDRNHGQVVSLESAGSALGVRRRRAPTCAFCTIPAGREPPVGA